MQTYIAMVNRLIARGYPRSKAIREVQSAYGLTAEQAAYIQQQLTA